MQYAQLVSVLFLSCAYLYLLPKLPKKAFWPAVALLVSAMLIIYGYGDGVSKVLKSFRDDPPPKTVAQDDN